MKIIADSSLDINEELEKLDINFVPFKLSLGEKNYLDDENLDPINFIKEMVNFDGLAKTACPSPNDFLDKLEENTENFIVTISSKLSGTYNSAKLAKEMFLENNEGKVHIFDSKAASVGETLTAYKLKELSEKTNSTDELIKKVEEYIDSMQTYFISENLDNLMKNGRISRFKGTLASLFNIKPIMGANDEGEIVLFKKKRGIKKAYQTLVQRICKEAKEKESKILAISHVNNLKGAKKLKEMIQKDYNFEKVFIVQTGGLSSLYCDNKGVILSF